jgi:hypothetical protein
MYGVWCDILSKGGASHMNDRATISNNETINEHGDGTVAFRATQRTYIFGPLHIITM